MSAPPVPPRPFDDYDEYIRKPGSSPPPAVPPLPAGFRIGEETEPTYPSGPHFEDPLVAPRPQKFQPDLPANMALTLNQQTSVSGPEQPRGRTPMPEADTGPMGFVMPRPVSRNPGSPLPPPQGSDWSPWAAVPDLALSQPSFPSGPRMPEYERPNTLYGHRSSMSLSASFSSLSFSDTPQTPSGFPKPQLTSSPPPSSSKSPSLTAPLPTIASLFAVLRSVEQPSFDPARKVTWCRDVLFLVERAQHRTSPSGTTSTEVPVGAARIEDPELQRIVNVAVPLILNLSSQQQNSRPPPHIAEAIYLRATCEATGAFPQFIQYNPRIAFRDFETAAKAGHHAAWFKLGRDYEGFNDAVHARDCFERGVKYGVESCLYRMGMAHLMGQLSLPPSPEAALPLLNRAATLATVDAPQPAYVYGLLLLNEFSQVIIPPALFGPYIPPSSSPAAEARKHIERAAYLNFAPAQYKLGHAYEFATPPFPFDALLSVQYYSLASQQGEIEADMALSKWFLCGAEGAFEKDEGLALTFAQKAAEKGLPSAEFAMGYYAEVGVGGQKDIDAARKWYTRASQHGNTDATERLHALSQPLPQALSREEHETLTDAKLVRRRTQAKQRSDTAEPTQGIPPSPTVSHEHGSQIIALARKNSMMTAVAPSSAASAPVSGRPTGPAGMAGVGVGTPNVGLGGPRPPGQPVAGSSPVTGGPPRLPPQQDQRRNASATLPPSQPTAPLQPRPHPGSTLPPSQQHQQQFANAPRYSLADPGGGSATGPRPPNLPTATMPGRPGLPRNQSRPNATGSPGPDAAPAPPKPAPPKGPQTFEEMGFRSQKLDDKECIVM